MGSRGKTGWDFWLAGMDDSFISFTEIINPGRFGFILDMLSFRVLLDTQVEFK